MAEEKRPKAPSVDATAQYFKALGDESRLKIVVLLAATDLEFSVLHLQEMTGLTQARVSRHLAVLRAASVVVPSRAVAPGLRGSGVVYRLQEPEDRYLKLVFEALVKTFHGKQDWKDLVKYGMRRVKSRE
jgi:DNA-binding transcriptional ArsR family regulator